MATSSCAQRRNHRLVRGALAGAALVGLGLLRALRTGGTTPAERAASLPGDDLVPSARVRDDHGVSIAAPPAQVWPWLVQMGQNKGGFYTFEGLQNLIGLGISNAHEINPQWQRLQTGDPVYLADTMALRGAVYEPEHALVLSSDGAIVTGATPGGDPGFDFSWAFACTPEGAGTRLLARERYAPHTLSGWGWSLIGAHASGVMTFGMLRSICARATQRVDSVNASSS